ncbi:MAG: DUF3575 domain-containing protein [Bacteroidales bacterium]|nr:DUF3575 domain-containing protein [Bacteroidales bacterium]
MKIKTVFAAALLLLVCFANDAKGQKAAIKTNLLYDATATINLGVEFGLNDRWTMDLSGNFNPFRFHGGHRWKHWMVQPELRYWFCDRFAGSFFAVHAMGGMYDVGNIDFLKFKILNADFEKMKNKRYEGWTAGVGVGWGHDWILSKHLNLEIELAAGYMYAKHDKYLPYNAHTPYIKGADRHFFAPTKAALSLVYVF